MISQIHILDGLKIGNNGFFATNVESNILRSLFHVMARHVEFSPCSGTYNSFAKANVVI